MSKQQPEQEEMRVKVKVKFKLDASSEATAKKLEIRSFREAVTKEAEMLLAHKIRTSSVGR